MYPTIGRSSACSEVVESFRRSTARWPAAVMRFPAVPQDNDPWLREARRYREDGFATVIVLPLPGGQRGDEIHKEIVDQLSALPTSALLFCRHLTQVEIAGTVCKTWALLRENHVPTVPMFCSNKMECTAMEVYWRGGQVSSIATTGSSSSHRDFGTGRCCT